MLFYCCEDYKVGFEYSPVKAANLIAMTPDSMSQCVVDTMVRRVVKFFWSPPCHFWTVPRGVNKVWLDMFKTLKRLFDCLRILSRKNVCIFSGTFVVRVFRLHYKICMRISLVTNCHTNQNNISTQVSIFSWYVSDYQTYMWVSWLL